ncbi:tyrosine-type recombinase/integrase [Nocardioides xinjiangensis]|uniref:tyrosine-type recombinase/integrase n=1 Tax=Nocardioides xinjiangensis TaxID=2817376 RepID=UPI001B309AFC|nr:site-specific integrase [Nocardioides sp. SYSU D00514]
MRAVETHKGKQYLDPKPGKGKSYVVARVRVRRLDGSYAELQRRASGQAAAERAIDKALADWAATPSVAAGDTIKPTWTVERLGQHWLAHREQIGLLNTAGDLGASSLAQMEATFRTAILGERKTRVDGKWVLQGRERGIASLRLGECSRATLQAWLSGIENAGGKTDQARTVLNQMLQLAVDDGALRENPMSRVAPTKHEAKEVEALSLQRCLRLRHLLEPSNRGVPGAKRRPGPDLAEIVAFALGTAARPGEVLAVRWMDLDLDDIEPSTFLRGTLIEARKPTITKTYRQPWCKDHSDRILYLPPALVAILEARYERLIATRTVSADETVFATRTGGLREPANVRSDLRRATANIAELAGTSPHTLRRSVATLLARSVTADAAGAQLGHKGSLGRAQTITQRHYIARAKVAPDSSHVLERLFGTWDPNAAPDEEDRLAARYADPAA